MRDEDRSVVQRFVTRTAEGMAARGWEAVPDRVAGADSPFLGVFQQGVAPDWLAIVEVVREGGPIFRVELRLTGLRKTVEFRAAVGGELGLRHIPTQRLLRELCAVCEADITRDLEDVFAQDGVEQPVITDDQSADRAAQMLLATVDAHALPFAREHADIDAVVAFITTGQQKNRGPESEYRLIPALLAATGRYTDARAALDGYRQRPEPPLAEQGGEYSQFVADLTAWIERHVG